MGAIQAALRAVAAGALLASTPAAAELDLKRAEVSRLANGLTVVLLEDPSLPMVSAQMLYQSGSRDETAGKTGLAHFLEHLAFRASRDFPSGAATEAIYDSGGEWHGYTWLDQTTYYSTMPTGGLDLLLRIEADRMANVIIDPAAIEAEKGAVITEMHGSQNHPQSVLLDAVAAHAFEAHPYRNNTIGYESDVAALTIEDARAFYERHYVPGNAVLAIAGDFVPEEAKALVQRHFGSLPARPAPRRVAAVEPPQRGVRRVEIEGLADRQYFQVAWPAPAASSGDFPAFLVLQQLLSGGSGVNFRQNEWGTPAEGGSAFHGITDDFASWFIPTANRYLFAVQGSTSPGADRPTVEQAIERRLRGFLSSAPTAARMGAAKAAVARQLADDVGSSEDAAHQLAFFAGLGALDQLLNLPDRVASVSAADVQRIARSYLDPRQRTIGWYIPAEAAPQATLGAGSPQSAQPRPGVPPRGGPAPAPELRRLSGGLPVIVQPNPASQNLTLQLLLSGPVIGGDPQPDLVGFGTVTRSGSPAELPNLLASIEETSARAPLAKRTAPSPHGDDPEARLEQMILELMQTQPVAEPRPMALVVSGAVDPGTAFRLAEQRFGRTAPDARSFEESTFALPERPSRRSATIAKPLPQGALGYVVPGPSPGTREGLAWRMLLYILTHDYSGRLGRSAITDKGLAYHIYSAYRTDGRSGWATIWTGVDPASADALEAELRAQLDGLATRPPSRAEVDAARRHLLGRDLSGAQTNAEIAAKLTRDFVETGGVRSNAELKALLETITPNDVAAAVPGFRAGTILRVDVAGH